MAEEKKRGGHHTLMMEEREKLQIGGVLEVISFDEEGVMMETTCGLLVLKGAELHIGKLDVEEGEVTALPESRSMVRLTALTTLTALLSAAGRIRFSESCSVDRGRGK